MDENFRDALLNGIEGETFHKLAEQNLGKNYFPKQAVTYFKIMSEMANDNIYVPFTNKLKFLLESGLSSSQIRSYLRNNMNSIDTDQISFVTRAISNTTNYEKKL